MVKPTHTKKKRREAEQPSRMTPEEAREALDAWARDENATVVHKQRVLTGDLIEYAERAGINWKAPGGLEEARKVYERDAARGRKFVEGMGRPLKVPPEDLCAAVALGHARHPLLTWNKVCGNVATEHGVSRQTVLDHTRKISWGKRVKKMRVQ